MIIDTTVGVQAASTRAWVDTFVVDTGLIERAIGASRACRMTIRRTANVFLQA